MSESTTMPADLAEIIATHRELFGGFTMMADGPEAPSDGDEGDAGTDKAFTQADVDRIIAERLKREDVKGLKSKAAEYDKLAEAQKTAEQKAADAQRAAEARAVEAEAKAIRYQVAAEDGISKADADLFLTGTDEDTIRAQAKRLIERDADRKKQGNHVPGEGRTPKNPSKDDPLREFTRQLFDKDSDE